MLSFCPYCANMLLISQADDGCNRFYCPTCPYEFKINGFQMYDRKLLSRKEVDDVLGGDGAWDLVDQTAAQCPIDSCGGDKAYFFQLQIRSADEPMTTFYKCVKCAHQWREN
ncbi:DNA-directed RNA polymerase subunit [[Candida] zeylanoides]|jgi:DNA-directed RNA polymerase III subunit RPC11